jgi:hypothetical protein
MTHVERAWTDITNEMERQERKLTWEQRIELMEDLKEFVEERLEELRNENHA